MIIKKPDWEHASEFAELFAQTINETRGAPRARAWAKAGVGARVYLGKDQYLSISRGGDISTTMRGQETFLPSAFHRSQLEALDEAKEKYRVLQWRELEIERLNLQAEEEEDARVEARRREEERLVRGPLAVAEEGGLVTYDVLLERKADLDAAFEQINKRARRKHIDELVWTWGKPFVSKEPRPGPYHETIEVDRIPLTIPSKMPHYSGWSFAAALQHLDTENIVRSVEGRTADLPRKYLTSGPVCEHCLVPRRRGDTYVLRHEDGRFIQVGTSCLQDFLGSRKALGLAAYASILAEARALAESGEELLEFGGRGMTAMPLERYMAMVALFIRQFGWVSAKMAQESALRHPEGKGKQPTGDEAWDELTRPLERGEQRAKPTPEDESLSAQSIEWAENLSDEEVDAAGMGGYLHNIRAIARSGIVDWRTRRMAASMVAAYQRAMGIKRARPTAIPDKPVRPRLDEWLGTVGEKLTVVVTLEFRHEFSSAYGPSTILKFATPEGAVVVWKASGSQMSDADLGKTYRVSGTVKAHDTYKDRKQTVLTRAKVEEVPEGTTLEALPEPEKRERLKIRPPMPAHGVPVTRDEVKFIKTVLANKSFPSTKDFNGYPPFSVPGSVGNWVDNIKYSRGVWIELNWLPIPTIEAKTEVLEEYLRLRYTGAGAIATQYVAILGEMFETTAEIKKMIDAGRSLLAKLEAKRSVSATPNPGRGIALTEPQVSFLEIEILGRFIDDQDEPQAAELAMAVAESLEASDNRRLDLEPGEERLLRAIILDVLNFIDDEIENYKKGDRSALGHIGGVDTLQAARGLYKTGESLYKRLGE